jgi:hypothetical protein
MHYVVRIGGVVIGVVVGSALLSFGLVWALTLYGLGSAISGGSVFAGLLTAGLVGAVLTRDSWFFA